MAEEDNKEASERIAEKVVRQSVSFDKNLEIHESKWRKVLRLRSDKFESMKDRLLEEDIELEVKKNQAEAQRKMSMVLPRLSRQSIAEEKRLKADLIKQETMKLMQQAKEEKLRRINKYKNWLKVIHDLKNLQKISKQEKDEEILRERAQIQEKQQELRERCAKERELKKAADEEWKRVMSRQVKEKQAKRRKKRKEEEPDLKLFVSRFRQLQIEAQQRQRRENLRKMRQEQKLLQEKKKRYQQELLRRAEVEARLEHMKKIRDMNDMKRMAEIEQEDKKYAAQHSVYQAQKKLLDDATEQLRKHAKKKRKEMEKIKQKKIEAKKIDKARRESLRRTAVSKNVAKYRQKSRLLALRRAEQLAADEIEWRENRAQQKVFNQWVSVQWSKRAQQLRELELKKLVACQEREEEEKINKKKFELERRADIEHRITSNRKKLDEKKKHDEKANVQEATQKVRQQVLALEQKQHEIFIRKKQEQNLAEAQSARKHAEENRSVYIQDREQQLQKYKNMKSKVLKPTTKKVWK